MADDELALWTAFAQSRDTGLRNQLVERHLPLARTVAATLYARRGGLAVEFADYLQLATLGLIEAVNRFDAGRGVAFASFATVRVRGSVLNALEDLSEHYQQMHLQRRLRAERLDSLRHAAPAADAPDADHREAAESEGWAPEPDDDAGGAAAAGLEPVDADDAAAAEAFGQRTADSADDGTGDGDPARPAADAVSSAFDRLANIAVGLALAQMLEGSGMLAEPQAALRGYQQPFYGQTHARQLREALARAVLELPEQERRVVRYHYFQNLPFSEVAELMGLTRGRVSQIHRHALTLLRLVSAADGRLDRLL